ncbi:type I restriction enzyme S subunit [Porphyrobacter sp. MBR-155]|jgi:type I restriction enzyme S subunit|uniref:restriction endonuclease subunit S n=1 Tax=Porphyrobacter sp. MBR-155 TaxID=3156464 RepID=UPI003396B98C
MSDPQTNKLSHYFTHSKRKGRPGLPLASVTMNDGLVLREDMDRKMDTSLSAEQHSLVEPGDIAYNMMRMWQGAFGLASAPVNVSPAYVVLRAKSTLDPRFAAHWLKSDRALYLLWAYSYGLTDDRLRLYPKEFLQIPVQWPDLDEQRRIVAVLDAWDEAISACEKLAKSKQKLLISAAERQLDCWPDAVELGTLTRVNSASLPNATAPDFEFEYFPIGDDDEAGGWMTYSVSPSRARRLAKPGDVAYSTVRPLLRRLFIVHEHPSAVFSTGYAILSPKENGDSAFIFHLMTSAIVERQVHARVTGSGYPAISASDLKTIKIPKIPKDQRTRIGQTLTSASDEVKQLEAMANLLRNQKRGLMQKLLTGKLPVPKSIDALLPGTIEVAA